MKDKKFKYYEDLIEEYVILSDEIFDLPLAMAKQKEKLASLVAGKGGTILKSGEANDAYKIFLQIKKFEARKVELEAELNEVQDLLKEFFNYLQSSKLAFKERDEEEKTKTTYSFWLEDGVVKSDR